MSEGGTPPALAFTFRERNPLVYGAWRGVAARKTLPSSGQTGQVFMTPSIENVKEKLKKPVSLV
jgi:hypothetical protein